MGNSTRLMGIAQSLRHRFRAPREKLRLVICTGGKTAAYWSENASSVQAEVVRLDDYVFSEHPSQCPRIRWSGFIRPRSAAVYLRNSLRLRALIESSAVDLALIDSDYHCLPLLLAGIPIAALGQARDVLRRYATNRHLAPIPPWNMLIERLDFQFQRLISRSVLVPCFEPAAAQEGSVTALPLIVREEFTAAGRSAGPQNGLYVLTGGSGIGSAALLDYAKRYDLPVIGSFPEPSTALDIEGRPLIDRASAVIIQGGLSSISECIARQKKMIILPIEGHAEQVINAVEVERRGLGLRVSELSASPNVFLERLERISPAAPERSWPQVNGAQAAARTLIEMIGLDIPV
ncbi:MAG: glycosyltransferase family protein [Elusimicrobiota bacterium]